MCFVLLTFNRKFRKKKRKIRKIRLSTKMEQNAYELDSLIYILVGCVIRGIIGKFGKLKISKIKKFLEDQNYL